MKHLGASEVPVDSYEHLSPCDRFASGCHWPIAIVAHASLGGWLRGKSKLETGLPFMRGKVYQPKLTVNKLTFIWIFEFDERHFSVSKYILAFRCN